MEANGALGVIVGKGALAGTRLGDLMTTGSRAEAAASYAAGRPGPYEVTLTAGPKTTAHLYLAPSGTGTVAYLVDVSEQKQMELQLAQCQKMQAIGQLAGGVAHDFNNLLTAIQLRLDELLHRHPVGDPSYEGLTEIRQTAVRAADLVRQLLAFSRKATVQRETLDLGELISEFEVLLRRLLREDVKLDTDYGRNLPLVRADKAQLENAVMNLVVNARDAVCAHGGGAVRMRTARVTRARPPGLGYAGPGGRDGPDRGGRRRARHPARGDRQDLRALLHHQGGGRGNGPGPRHRLRHRQAVGRLDLGALDAGRGRGVPHLPAGLHPAARGGTARRRRPNPPPRRATSPAPAASCSSRTRTPCAASPPACCAPAAMR